MLYIWEQTAYVSPKYNLEHNEAKSFFTYWYYCNCYNNIIFLKNYAKISRIAKNELFMSFSPQQR